jgi:hypothetical protein
LRPVNWAAPDQTHVAFAPDEPRPVDLNTGFPALACAALNTPRTPAAADLGSWIATDESVPSVPPCQFSLSNQPLLPMVGSILALAVAVAPGHSAWQPANTFFTPRRRIAQPEPTMRRLPAPESGARPMSPTRLRPAHIAGINDQPWKLADNRKPFIPHCDHVTQPLQYQLANPRPAPPVGPKYVFQDTFPAWEAVPNSYVRRIELPVFTEAVTLLTISAPLAPLGH